MYKIIIILAFIIKYHINKYFKINKMLESPKDRANHNENTILKYKKIKFILIYQKGDNIKESVESLYRMTIPPTDIIIIGKNINIKTNQRIKIYNEKFTEKLLNNILLKYQTKNDIIGIYQTNTIFNMYLSEKVIAFFNKYDCNKAYVLHDIITNNIFLEKYNFYNQLNKYSMETIYDFFTTDINSNGIIIKSFMISKIYNMNSLEYCFNNMINNKYHNIIILIKYCICFLCPSIILIMYITQLIFQIIIIFKNLSYNQALQADAIYIFIGNFLSFLKSILPQLQLNIKPLCNIKDNNIIEPNLKLIEKIDNGRYYQVVNSNLRIIHLYGNDYMKGYAYGKLCREDFIKMLSIIESYNIEPSNPIMKKYYKDHDSIKDCLLSIYDILKNYINSNHINMMKGISDGSNIKFEDIVAITLIPELYHQHCMLISHNTKDTSIFIRTLDYFFYMDNHILRVYHNTETNSYCELGIPGTIWNISTVSEKLVCLGETSGRFDYNTNLIGTPFYLYFKDIMANCNNITDALDYMKSIERNNNIFVIVSSLLENKATLIDSKEMKEYNTNNFIEYMDKYSEVSNYTLVKNTIFEYSEPNKLNNTLVNMDDFRLDNIQNSILKLYKTGGNHSMIVDSNYNMYIQVNSKNNPAYNSNMYVFNLKEIFNN